MSQATLDSTPYRNSNLFSGYYLDERIDDVDEWKCDEEARIAFESLQDLWRLEGNLLPSSKEDELLDTWIDRVLEILGFGTISEATLPNGGGYNDRLLFESDETRRDAAERKRDGDTAAMYGLASAVLEAKQWDAGFNERFSERRSYRDASHQIKYYLERTPERMQWGILTDGKKWRLYGTKDYATETYYEVDLPALLESGNLDRFKYFYAFFRPEAFRETAGTSFLDTVWNESETAAQELGEDLQDNVFTALRVLGEGFVHTNDLDIDPDDGAARERLKEQSLVLLYRLMFVLYAESRGLIHPDDPDAEAEYEEHFSLDQLRFEIHDNIDSGDTFEDYSGFSTRIWGQLEDLFTLVDEGEDSLGIPPYNGGLFDDAAHEFLAENEVADRYIAEVIYRLGTTAADDGSAVLADYADLDTRHLGSIYEGLLEHEFRIAPEQYAAVAEDGGQVWQPATEVSVAEAVETVDAGELFVVNDDGERKATGAYYTPDYVVSYIVEETIDPLLEDIKAGLEADGLEPSDREYFARFWQSVLDLKVLDPAMGSAHFLTSTTGYLTEQVMEVVREQEIQSYDEQELRRDIAKECIYGVDVNGMAVELGKLSMWLETLAADKPLAFLDHHLRAGNSLVGSDITEVLSDDVEENGGQLTLSQAFAHARQQTLEHVMELMEDLLAIDNDELADIKSMEDLYDEIRADPLYQRLFEIANVHTAEQFGVDVPEGVYEEMAAAIEDEDGWAEIRDCDWFRSAQATAAEEDFFHWELEFPEVFFGENGEKRVDAGFDAVVGNPPYVRQEQISRVKPFLEARFSSYNSSADLYVYFIEKATDLLEDDRELGYIVSNKFMRSSYGKNIRSYLTNNATIEHIIDFGELPVFSGVSTFPAIIIVSSEECDHQSVQVSNITDLDFSNLSNRVADNYYDVGPNGLRDSGWSLAPKKVSEIQSKIDEQSVPLQDYIDDDIYWGIKTGLNDAFVLNKSKRRELISNDGSGSELIKPLIVGDDIRKYRTEYSDQYILVIPSGWTAKQSGYSSEQKAWSWFKEQYENIATHLSEFEQQARDRYDQGEFWWELRPCDYYDIFGEQKLIYPEIAMGPRFTIDTEEYYLNNKCYAIPQKDLYLLAILNSSLMFESTKLRVSVLGDADSGGRLELRTVHVKNLPILPVESSSEDAINDIPKTLLADSGAPTDYDHVKESVSTPEEHKSVLEWAASEMLQLNERFADLNISLLDHLGTYSDGPTLADVGFTQPPKGSADSVLQETTEQKPNLRVGEATIKRESATSVEVRLTARYKPDGEGAFETDQWGYTETDPLPALRITDLTETEADLIEAFVPVAVDEAGGFAGFRETATKTNSLVDRLRALTLPAVDEVEAGLESYVETMERAEELEEKIERTDELIDEIVYELYGLTDEEIEIVEAAVEE